MTTPRQRFKSDEMAELMDRVQELMEANVLAMLLRLPNGKIAVTCPPSRLDETVALLKAHDWKAWQP